MCRKAYYLLPPPPDDRPPPPLLPPPDEPEDLEGEGEYVRVGADDREGEVPVGEFRVLFLTELLDLLLVEFEFLLLELKS